MGMLPGQRRTDISRRRVADATLRQLRQSEIGCQSANLPVTTEKNYGLAHFKAVDTNPTQLSVSTTLIYANANLIEVSPTYCIVFFDNLLTILV